MLRIKAHSVHKKYLTEYSGKYAKCSASKGEFKESCYSRILVLISFGR